MLVFEMMPVSLDVPNTYRSWLSFAMMPTEERWLTPGVRGIATVSFLADVSY